MAAPKRRRKGEGALHFRPEKGLWVYEAELPRGADGKRRRRVLYGSSRADLMRKVADLRAKGGGNVAPVDPGTIADLVTRWLSQEIKPNKRPKTFEAYELAWRGHAAPIIGGVRLSAFGPDHVAYLYDEMRRQGASTDAVARVGRVMHTAIEAAIRRGAYNAKNPFAQIERPKHSAKEGRTLDVAEARRFLDAADGDRRFSGLWRILLFGGLRIGEAVALRWRDVDLENAAVAITHSASDVAGRVVVGPTKTKSSKRRVYLGPMAVDALRQRLKDARAERHDSANDFVFCSTSGRAMSQNNLRRRHFAPILKRAGLVGITPHTLRHTSTSLGVAAGLQPKVLSERLGHTTTKLTMDTYSHLMPGSGAAAAAAIEELLKP
jgi:integrase